MIDCTQSNRKVVTPAELEKIAACKKLIMAQEEDSLDLWGVDYQLRNPDMKSASHYTLAHHLCVSELFPQNLSLKKLQY